MTTDSPAKTDSLSLTTAPLDDARAYEILDAHFQRESKRQALGEFSRLDDDELLGELVDAGFSPNTLPAIDFVPLVFAAWASDTVTEEENRVAMTLIYDSRLYEFPAALARVQTWLDVRPDEDLMSLWKRFTRARSKKWTVASRYRFGRKAVDEATAIAKASGGVMGFGSICAAESKIIREIESVYFSTYNR